MQAIDLCGEPTDIGFQHGRALAGEIRECLEIYQDVIGSRFSDLVDVAHVFAEGISAFAPEIGEEIEGIAAGAGVEPYEITLLNARSELMSSADSAADGCTAIYQPRAGLLAQTWDWIEAIEPLFRVLRIQRPDGRSLLTATEPGMVGKIGLNSSGLGCTLNFMYSPGVHRGTPIHVLLRQVLECTSMAAVRDVLMSRVPGQSGNIMVGDTHSEGLNFEFAGDEVSETQVGIAPFVHTNHHLVKDISAGTLTPNSHARHARATAMTTEACPNTVQDIARVLSDAADSDHPICAPYKPMLGTQIGTVSTVIMALAKDQSTGEPGAQMHIRRGPEPTDSFQSIAL